MKSISLERLRKRALVGGTVFILILAFASFSWASTITTSVEFTAHGVTFPSIIAADVIMTYTRDTTILDKSTLSFVITNASTADDSSLTAFAFNVPDPPPTLTVASFSASDGTIPLTTWRDLSPDGRIDGGGWINTPGRLGLFDLGGITGKKGFNGGDVKNGIYQGKTFSFDFYFTGTGLDSLTASDFFTLSDGEGQQSKYFAARFQGIYSDFLELDDDSDVAAFVPIPGAIVLLGSGLLGLAGIRRKFFS